MADVSAVPKLNSTPENLENIQEPPIDQTNQLSDEEKSMNRFREEKSDSNHDPPNGKSVEDLFSDLDGLLLDQSSPSKNSQIDVSFANGISEIAGNEKSTEESNVEKMTKLYNKYNQRCQEIEKLEKENQHFRELSATVSRERDSLQQQLRENNHSYNAKCQEYERRINELDSQTKVLRDRSVAQEEHFRKTMAEQQAKFNAQIEHLKRSTDQANREKDAAVIKYAQREKELLTMEANVQRAQQHAQQMTLERDALSARLRAAKNEKQQIVQVVEQKENEIIDLKKDLERVKTFIQEADLRVKLANKRAEENETFSKDAKFEHEKLQKKLKEAKEETEIIRAECQRMIKNYQEAAEKKTLEIEVQKQEHSDQDEIYRMVADELEALKKRHKETLCEYEEIKQKSSAIEEELDKRRRDASDKTVELDCQKERIDGLKSELESLQSCVDELTREQRKTRELERSLAEARQDQADCEQESAQSRANAERMLELMQQLTQKNSVVQAENCCLSAKLQMTENENAELVNRCGDLEARLASVDADLQQIRTTTSFDLQQLRDELAKKAACESHLMTDLEDEQNQNAVLRKKHAASIKELKSELSVLRRRLEAYESGTASQGSGGSVGGDDREPSISSTKREFSASRASSYTSLDAVGSGAIACNRIGDSPVSGYENAQHHSVTFHMQPGGGQHQGVCEHNQAMIEKIVKLQRMLARRTEKIEFLEEHAKQLVAELQKKSRLVQMYALRDESGALAPESVDVNKLMKTFEEAQLAKRGHTIMGSVYGGISGGAAASIQQHFLASGEGPLSVDLALQIINKLQAVLEDTLIKNMTLKDNMETLGEEIARISRENRELKLRHESSTR